MLVGSAVGPMVGSIVGSMVVSCVRYDGVSVAINWLFTKRLSL